MTLYMFGTICLSIIRSLFTVHSAMVYVIQVRRQSFEQDQDGIAVTLWSCSKAVYKPVWHIPLLSVQWINSWWWVEELAETCGVSCQNKFVKLVHLVGFIIKKFVPWSRRQLKLKSTPNVDCLPSLFDRPLTFFTTRKSSYDSWFHHQTLFAAS